MLRYSATTRLTPAKAIERASKHFAESGGLKVKSRSEGNLCLEADDGYVTMSACRTDPKGRKTSLDFETDRYDLQVTEFLKSL